MPKVQAWQCPETGKLFAIDARDRYVNHLRKIRQQRMLRRTRKKAEATFIERRNEFWRTTMSFEDIETFIVENAAEVFAQCSEFQRRDHKGHERPTPLVEQVSFGRMRWDEYVSNTHSAPVGKPTNWGRKDGLPLGYPGWKGEIIIEYRPRNNNENSFDSTGLARWGIHTGSGGGGPNRHRYEVIIFEEEFINLAFSMALMRPPK